MKTALCLLGLLLHGSSTASPAPSTARVYVAHGQHMTLRGEAVLRVGYLFKVYEARLFVGADHATDTVLSDVPKRLEIRYLRDIAAEDIIRISHETLQRQVPPDTLNRLQARLDTINGWYADVGMGDVYALTYIPGRGCELALNGVSRGIIDGEDFAQAYFGIWLDPRTAYRNFRRELLGERQHGKQPGS